jgi:transcription antitermination factor NusG
LEWKQIEAFLPLHTARRKRQGHWQQYLAPLFPGYVFCRTALDIPFRIVSIPGVIGFVGCDGHPSPVKDEEIEAIRHLEQCQRPLRAVPLFTEGERVRVTSGALAGLEGRIQRVKGKSLLVVSVEMLNRAVLVSLDGDCVAPA